MAQDFIYSSHTTEGESKAMTWELTGWGRHHEVLVAGQANCLVEFDAPKVILRYFLRPVEKTRRLNQSEIIVKYFSLCAEVIESTLDCVVVVSALIPVPEMNSSLVADGHMALQKGRRGRENLVIEEFIPVAKWFMNNDGVRSPSSFDRNSTYSRIKFQQDVSINIKCTLYRLKNEISCPGGCKHDPCPVVIGTENDSDVSMMRNLRDMYSASDNFADVKLKSKDSILLSAHKFLMAARSPLFRVLIEETVNKEDFDGVIPIAEVNSQPLSVILHWMYTGELHENAGEVAEELVEAAIQFKLADLLKLVDRKLIGFCTKENMFHLFQVAKNTAMPTAIEDISNFIKENL